MKHRSRILSFLLLLSLLLGACTQAATEAPEVVEATEVTVVEQPTDMPEPEPTAVPVEPEDPFTETDLDAAFNIFLMDMEKYNTISLADFNAMLVEKPDTFILDVRETSELEEKGWIPGAVHIPLRDLADHTDLLPSYDTTIVSYCGSGWRCTIALTALEAMGWEDVLCLKDNSFSGWVEAGYPIETGDLPVDVSISAVDLETTTIAYFDDVLTAVPAGFGIITPEDLNLAIVENPGLVLIDARTAEEVASKGAIDAPNVLFIPLQDFINGKAEWPADLNAPIVVYCGSGHRSTIAMTMLWSYGYTDVRSLKGGFGSWTEAGFATIGGEPAAPDLDAAFSTFLGDMVAYNTISVDNLNLMIVEEQDFFLLDVRQPEELLEKGWIEGAVNIPLRELADHTDLLPSFDTTIVSYCGSGWRCTIALTALEALGWENVLCLKGDSFAGWVAAGYPVTTGTEVPAAETLSITGPDQALLDVIGKMLAGIPDGYGGISPADLNTLLVENPDVILIDARTETEITEKGIIDAPNVIRIPLESFIEMKDMWPDMGAKIIVYCGSGHRSTIAMTILWAYGYSDVLSLKGGFGAWTEAGYAIVPAE
jgi:rhodanese-related sulfurtransferase